MVYTKTVESSERMITPVGVRDVMGILVQSDLRWMKPKCAVLLFSTHFRPSLGTNDIDIESFFA